MISRGLYSLRNILIITSASILYLYIKIFYGQSYGHKLFAPPVFALVFVIGSVLACVRSVLLMAVEIYFSYDGLSELWYNIFLSDRIMVLEPYN
jgi:hypothetical protein